MYEDSVLPVVEAGLAEIIDGAGAVADSLVLRPTSGHTVGHLAVQLAANGDEALFTGDLMHSPLQVCRPEWNRVFCEDAEAARISRRWALEHAAERQVTVFTAHFGGSSAGHVQRKGERFAWTGA